MIDAPYKVLGVSQGAGQDEIKKAYRRLAKEYHPDLHPNDPAAARKMNEINEAYDMAMNPEKYAARRAQQQAQQQQAQQQRQYYGGGGQQSSQSQYRGPGGWASSDWGFDFDDFFGFGFGGGQQRQAASTKPQAEPMDSPEIRRVVTYINAGQYQEAVYLLTRIPSTGRNARWYYLSAQANQGQGNTVQAVDQMQRAVQMDPNNQAYHQLLQQFRQAGQTYERNAQGFNMQAMDIQKLCLGLCAAQFCCGYCGMFRCC